MTEAVDMKGSERDDTSTGRMIVENSSNHVPTL